MLLTGWRNRTVSDWLEVNMLCVSLSVCYVNEMWLLVPLSCDETWSWFVSDIAIFVLKRDVKLQLTRMWANAQPDGRPAEHRWRPLFNAANYG